MIATSWKYTNEFFINVIRMTERGQFQPYFAQRIIMRKALLFLLQIQRLHFPKVCNSNIVKILRRLYHNLFLKTTGQISNKLDTSQTNLIQDFLGKRDSIFNKWSIKNFSKACVWRYGWWASWFVFFFPNRYYYLDRYW